jgi:hypothetical protein
VSCRAGRACRRELAVRVSGSVEVALYWNPEDDSTSVELRQPGSGEAFAFAVPRERALAAFHDPFDHLPPTGDRTASTARRR